MAHALDRESLAEVMVKDRGLVSDSWIQRGTPVYQAQGSKIVTYPYDPARAAQLFQEAGWNRAPDGILQTAAGDKFKFECWCAATYGPIMQGDWKRAGVDSDLVITPPQLSSNLEYQASFPGIQGTGNAISFSFIDGRFHSRNIARAENRWGGQNRSAYADPMADELVERLLATLDQAERWNVEGDLANLITRNAVFWWLYHPTPASVAKKGMIGIKPNRATGHSGDLLVTWNIAEWDLTR